MALEINIIAGHKLYGSDMTLNCRQIFISREYKQGIRTKVGVGNILCVHSIVDINENKLTTDAQNTKGTLISKWLFDGKENQFK